MVTKERDTKVAKAISHLADTQRESSDRIGDLENSYNSMQQVVEKMLETMDAWKADTAVSKAARGQDGYEVQKDALSRMSESERGSFLMDDLFSKAMHNGSVEISG